MVLAKKYDDDDFSLSWLTTAVATAWPGMQLVGNAYYIFFSLRVEETT